MLYDFISCTPEEEKKFEEFYRMLCDYNKKVNLTAITERSEFFIKHICDSLAGAGYFPNGAEVAEVGSGGLPLRSTEDSQGRPFVYSVRERRQKMCLP